jgi:hypothetical protein
MGDIGEPQRYFEVLPVRPDHAQPQLDPQPSHLPAQPRVPDEPHQPHQAPSEPAR